MWGRAQSRWAQQRRQEEEERGQGYYEDRIRWARGAVERLEGEVREAEAEVGAGL
jgi:hypothetical protein